MSDRLRHTTRLATLLLPLWVVSLLLLARQSPVPRDALDAQPLQTRIDLNAATAAELELLPRVGPALADAIVAHRDRIGGFTRVEELDDVPRIGPATLRQIEPWVEIGEAGGTAGSASDVAAPVSPPGG